MHRLREDPQWLLLIKLMRKMRNSDTVFIGVLRRTYDEVSADTFEQYREDYLIFADRVWVPTKNLLVDFEKEEVEVGVKVETMRERDADNLLGDKPSKVFLFLRDFTSLLEAEDAYVCTVEEGFTTYQTLKSLNDLRLQYQADRVFDYNGSEDEVFDWEEESNDDAEGSDGEAEKDDALVGSDEDD